MKATAYKAGAVLSAILVLAPIFISIGFAESSQPSASGISTNQGWQIYPYPPSPPILTQVKDLVRIDVMEESGTMVARVSDEREFRAETVPHTGSASDKPDDIGMSFLLPRGAYDIHALVDGEVASFTRASGQYGDRDYDAFLLSVPWGRNSLWDENHYEMYPIIDISYSSALERSLNGLVLKYGQIPLTNQRLDLEIRLPQGSEVLGTDPEMSPVQEGSGVLLKMPPLGSIMDQGMVDVQVEFRAYQHEE